MTSSIVYVTADILCGLRYPGYSFTDQVISELSAIGAPTTALWVKLLQIFAVLFAAFTIAVVRESSGNRRLRLTGWLLVGFVLSGPLWSFVPMHQRGDVFTWTDAGHIALGGVTVLLLSAVIAVGAGALGRRFLLFSRILVTVAFIAGVWTFVYVPRMIEQRPTRDSPNREDGSHFVRGRLTPQSSRNWPIGLRDARNRAHVARHE